MTVENLSDANKPEHASQRSIEIIVIAIIAAFFVSLGANLAKIFNWYNTTLIYIYILFHLYIALKLYYL